MSIKDMFDPEWDQLLVEADPEEKQIGAGLVRPDNTHAHANKSGVILKAGPLSKFCAGQRIAFGRHAMTVIGLEESPAGEKGAVGLVPSGEVLCTFARGAPASPLSPEGADFACAPHGYMLAERYEIPESRGGVHLTDQLRDDTLSSQAIILSVGAGIEGWSVDEIVFLGYAAPKTVAFGVRPDRELWVISPIHVQARVLVPLPGEVEPEPDSPLRYRPPAVLDTARAQFVEGDPRAPR